MERDSYLLELARYVVLNPVRARMVRAPEDFAWSSYRGTVGLDPTPPGLSVDWMLGQFARIKAAAAEAPRQQRQVHRAALKKLLASVNSKAARNRAMARAYLEHGYTLTEIGQEAGLHYATVSRIIKAFEERS